MIESNYFDSESHAHWIFNFAVDFHLFQFHIIFAEIAKVQQSGRIPQREQKYVDIYREKQIRVTVKVLVPVKEHPKVSVWSSIDRL